MDKEMTDKIIERLDAAGIHAKEIGARVIEETVARGVLDVIVGASALLLALIIGAFAWRLSRKLDWKTDHMEPRDIWFIVLAFCGTVLAMIGPFQMMAGARMIVAPTSFVIEKLLG